MSAWSTSGHLSWLQRGKLQDGIQMHPSIRHICEVPTLHPEGGDPEMKDLVQHLRISRTTGGSELAGRGKEWTENHMHFQHCVAIRESWLPWKNYNQMKITRIWVKSILKLVCRIVIIYVQSLTYCILTLFHRHSVFHQHFIVDLSKHYMTKNKANYNFLVNVSGLIRSSFKGITCKDHLLGIGEIEYGLGIRWY